MSISRVKPLNWAVNEKLTSAQQNALDANSTYALDKRSGQTDILFSSVSVASGGTIAFVSGSSLTAAAGVTATIDSLITFRGAAVFTTGGSVSFASTITVASTGVLNSAGTSNYSSAAAINYNGNTITYTNASLNGTVSANLGFSTGSNVSLATGSTFTNSGTTNISGTATLTGSTSITNLTVAGGNRVLLSSRTLTRTLCAPFDSLTSNWTLQSGIDNTATPTTTSNSSAHGSITISLPDGVVINAIKMYVQGGSGHAGAPAGLPFISLMYKKPSVGGIGTVLGTKSDVYTSSAAYEGVHSINMTSLSHTVDRLTSKLSLYFESEYGLNALSGFMIHGVEVTYTTTSMDDGPCN